MSPIGRIQDGMGTIRDSATRSGAGAVQAFARIASEGKPVFLVHAHPTVDGKRVANHTVAEVNAKARLTADDRYVLDDGASCDFTHAQGPNLRAVRYSQAIAGDTAFRAGAVLSLAEAMAAISDGKPVFAEVGTTTRGARGVVGFTPSESGFASCAILSGTSAAVRSFLLENEFAQ